MHAFPTPKKKMEVISQWFIKPNHEEEKQVESSKKQPTIIYLNLAEISMLTIYPIQKGLFYPLNHSNNNSPTQIIHNLIQTLKHSLSLTLTHFTPLSGRLATETFPDEHACTVFIDCSKGLGARLTHVVAKHILISPLTTSRVPSVVRELFDLGEECVNYDGHTRPLLSVQVTELVDGVFIGFSVNHCVVDGISFMHFLSVLSSVFNNLSLEISRVPVYEQGPVVKLPYLGLKEVIKSTGRCETGPFLSDCVFHFSSTSLRIIKAKANECNDQKINGDEGRSVSNVSSFQGLLSLIWRSITRARNLSPDQETTCGLAINTRTRVDPPLSDEHVGNYVIHVKVKCKVGELLGHDLGWAANRLNEAIKGTDSKYIRDHLSMIADQITKPGYLSSSEDEDVIDHGSNNVVVGGSTRFDMYGLEFGLGKAVAIRMGPGNKTDGKVNVSQGREGVGSVELEISLKEEHMAGLETDREFMAFVS